MKRIGVFSIVRSVQKVRRAYRVSPQSGGTVVRAELESFGALGVKFGQILATRFDLVPLSLRSELYGLYTGVQQVPFEEIQEVLRQAWGQEGFDQVENIDPIPLASASIAQVHTGVYKGQEWVFKVVKPSSRVEIKQGITDLRRLRRVMGFLPVVRGYRSFIDQLVSMVQGELNMQQEASTIQAMQAACPTLRLPVVQEELTRKEVLVTSRLTGVSAHEVAPKDRVGVANQLLDAFFLQVFEHGVYHADMHHGNILVDNGKVQLLDFGMVGYLSAEERYALGLLCIGFVLRDERLVADGVLGLCPTEIRNPALFRSDLYRCMMKYTSYRLGSIDFEDSLKDLLGVLGVHRVKINPKLTGLVKTLVTLQGVVSDMDGGISIVGMLEARKGIIVRFMVRHQGVGAAREWLKRF